MSETIQVDTIGGFITASPNCRGCGAPLLRENAWMTDGCPCNSPLGVNSANETRWRLLMDLQQAQASERDAALAEVARLKGELEKAQQQPAGDWEAEFDKRFYNSAHIRGRTLNERIGVGEYKTSQLADVESVKRFIRAHVASPVVSRERCEECIDAAMSAFQAHPDVMFVGAMNNPDVKLSKAMEIVTRAVLTAAGLRVEGDGGEDNYSELEEDALTLDQFKRVVEYLKETGQAEGCSSPPELSDEELGRIVWTELDKFYRSGTLLDEIVRDWPEEFQAHVAAAAVRAAVAVADPLLKRIAGLEGAIREHQRQSEGRFGWTDWNQDLYRAAGIAKPVPLRTPTDELLAEHALLLNEHGEASWQVAAILENNKNNSEFIELAKTATRLRRALNKKPS